MSRFLAAALLLTFSVRILHAQCEPSPQVRQILEKATLSRRYYGETIKHLNTNYGYQFSESYRKFGEHPDQLPVDAHMLLALIAPRPVLLNTGDQDRWSDPKGEFLAAVAAEPVYRLLGKQGLGTEEWPAAGEAILHDIGYHMHAGGHGTMPGDWEHLYKFLEMHLRPAPAEISRRERTKSLKFD